MKIGTYVDGRDIDYDDARKSFGLDGSPISAGQVQEYDASGQMAWVSPDTKAWFDQNLEALKAAAPAPVAEPTPPAPGVAVPPPAYVPPAYSAPAPGAYPAPATGTYPPPAAAPKKNKWLIWVIIGVVVLVLLCGGCALIAALVPTSSSSGSGEKATEPAEVEPEAEPAEEVIPESDAVTNESSTPSTQQGFTQEEIDYSLAVADISITTGEAITSLGELLVNDPEGVISGGDAMVEAAGYAAVVQSEYQEAVSLAPPASMQAIHDAWLAGLKDYNDSMDMLADGIDNQDVASLEQAAALMTSGSEKITTANSLLTEFQTSRQ